MWITITFVSFFASFLAAFLIRPWALANKILWLEDTANVYMQIVSALFTVFVMFAIFAGFFIIAGIIFGKRNRQ